MVDQLTNEQKIVRALQYLAGVCDFASTYDDAGFNKIDAGFGHSLAEQTMHGGMMTPRQQFAAAKMLQKYRRQIEAAGLQVPEIIDPDKVSNGGVIEVKLHNQLILVKFPGKPAASKLEAVRALPDRRWEKDLPGTPWSIPARYVAIVLDAVKDWNADIDPAVIELVEKAPDAPKPQIQADVVITEKDGELLVSFPNPNGRSERLAHIKAAVPERKWKPDLPGKPWSIPGRYAPEVVKLFPDAEIDPAVKSMVERMETLAANSRKASSDFEVNGLGGELYPFQKAGVEFLEKANGRAIVADQMGLGKTVQALAYLQLHPELRPVILVVPASLKINWEREVTKWLTTPETIVKLEGRTAYDLSINPATIYIINYDILNGWKEELLKVSPQVLIADEAHYCKNSKAQRSKAVKFLAGKIDKFIPLTGTVITNRPVELYPILNMVAPKAWNNFMAYARQYCAAHHNGWGWDFSGASNLDELHEMTKPFMIRRTKDQVLKELPPKRRVSVVMEITGEARVRYNKHIADARYLAQRTEAEQLVFIEKAKQVAVEGKLEAAIEWIENSLESNGKLVVFAVHHSVIDRLMEHFGKIAVRVTGKENQTQRQEAVDGFQNDDKIKLFVGNIKAAGVGLTLTAASNAVFLEFGWTPGEHDQAEDRIHRIGQDLGVTIWYIVAAETIDEDIVRLLEEKRQVIDMVHDGKPGALDFSILDRIIEKVTVEK